MNYLLGRGERLTDNQPKVNTPGGKEPAYDADETRARTKELLNETLKNVENLPEMACPSDKIVTALTLHPRFVSKSDFPVDLLKEFGLRAIGGRSSFVTPGKWGVNKHPDSAVSDTWFVSSKKSALREWRNSIDSLEDKNEKAFFQLQTIESIYHPTPAEKIKPSNRETNVYEVILHNDGSEEIVDLFYQYADSLNIKTFKSYVKFSGGVTFVPVEADSGVIDDLSQYSFMRAIRKMPALRTYRPPIFRGDAAPMPPLPDRVAQDPKTKVAIFDGGLPKDSPLMPWVNYIEPPSIGPADPDAINHGEAVTSAYLFGHLSPTAPVSTPATFVDHIRVIGGTTSEDEDLEIYRVLDRILTHLDSASEKYEFVNLSLGPDMPIEDDEVTRWTSELDRRASENGFLLAVAAGNTGEKDHASGLNRIQPPSDGVNFLAVGACDSQDDTWDRCSYSSIGPGRTPGIAKPDGLSFGGSFDRPFGVIISSNKVGLEGTQGTSFASPNALRSATGIRALAGSEITPLGSRAILVHNAEFPDHCSKEQIGWGRFISNSLDQITCDDHQVSVMYQGTLPLKQYLRAPIPLPDGVLKGDVVIKATLVISPDVDPAFAHTYTRAGLQVSFRPNAHNVKTKIKDGKPVKRTHAETDSFFSESKLSNKSEYILRKDGHKWEPCWRAEKTKRGTSLNKPCFDIYYHTRDEGRPDEEPQELPYALLVTVEAKKEPELYKRTAELYSEILVPLEPIIEIPAT